MKRININEYNSSLGILICLDDKERYDIKHINGSINIPYERLLYNKDKLLNKRQKYYLYCSGGYKSRMATNLLTSYGYDVTQVLIK